MDNSKDNAKESKRMGIAEVLQHTAKAWQAKRAMLVREGTFWRAYEEAALTVTQKVSSFKVTTRYVKCVGQWVSYVGFPVSTFEKWCGSIPSEKDGDLRTMLALSPEDHAKIAEMFAHWKEQQVEAAKEDAKKSGEEAPASSYATQALGRLTGKEKRVIMMILSFPLESSTPIECMLFVHSLKSALRSDDNDYFAKDSGAGAE